MLDAVTRHEPGVWKQQNKSHRSIGHRSKREVQAQHRGNCWAACYGPFR